MSDLTTELQRMAEGAARQAQPHPLAEVVRRGGRRRRWAIAWQSVGALSVVSVTVFGVLSVTGVLTVSHQRNHQLMSVAANRPASGLPVPASAIPRLRAIADRFVRGDAQTFPEWASVVTTSHKKALAAAAPAEWTVAGVRNITVYLVTIKGRFSPLPVASPLPGHGPLTGKYLSIVVDAKAFHVLYLGLGTKSPGAHACVGYPPYTSTPTC